MERVSGPSFRASDGERSCPHSPRTSGRTGSPALVIDLSAPDVVDLTQDSPELPRKRRRSQNKNILSVLTQSLPSDQPRRRKPRPKRCYSDFREEKKRPLCHTVKCENFIDSVELELTREYSSSPGELQERWLDLDPGRSDCAVVDRSPVESCVELFPSPGATSAMNRCWSTQGASSSSAISIPDDSSPVGPESSRRLRRSSPSPPLPSSLQAVGPLLKASRPCKRRSNKRFRNTAGSLAFTGAATSFPARSSHGSSPPPLHIGQHHGDTDEAADELLARALQRIYEEEDGVPTYTPLPLVDSTPLSLAWSRLTDSATYTSPGYPNSIASWPYEALLSLTDRLGNARKLGMTQTAIRAIPTVCYEPSGDHTRQDTCVICLSEFQAGDQLRQLPCVHRFHRKCVDNWLTKNKACPICRTSAAVTPR